MTKKTHDIQVTKVTQGDLLVIRVGNDSRPAGPEDLKAIQKQLQISGVDGLTAVTHHAIDFFVVPEMNENETLVIRVGSDNRPASPSDIAAISKSLAQLAVNGGTLVTHHAVDYFTLDRRRLENVVAAV